MLKVQQVSCGRDFTIAIVCAQPIDSPNQENNYSSDNIKPIQEKTEVYAWGSNGYG